MLPALKVGDRNEGFERCVAGARAHAGKAGVDADSAGFHRSKGVGDGQAEVLMGVDAAFGVRTQDIAIGAHALHARRSIVSLPPESVT